MATKAKKAASKKAPAKKSAKAAKPAAKKTARRLQEQHFLPPWVVIGKPVSAAIVGVSGEFTGYVVSYFDAPSGWVELRVDGTDKVRRTHYNNIVLDASAD